MANFRNLYSGAVAPATVHNQNHMLVVDDYAHTLYDYIKRDFPLAFAVNSVRASGYPHVWNEQTKIPNNTVAVDPQKGFGTLTDPSYRPSTLDTDYGRNNWKQAFIRAYVTGIRYNFFELNYEKDYGSFEDLTVKDYNDMFVDFRKTTQDKFWNGTTALDATDTFDYCGVLSQITDVTAITSGTIFDNINTKIASLQARLDYSGMPNVLCMNSATYDLLTKEVREEYKGWHDERTREIIAGVEVPALYTHAGLLPVIITPFIKPETGSGTTTHKIVALNTHEIDRIWMFNDGPKVYEFANPNNPLGNDALLTDKMVMDFANYIVHGANTGMHFILTKTV